MGFITESVKKSDSFIIYGAQILAASAYTAIKELCGISPRFFAVSDRTDNPDEIDGIKVITLNEYAAGRNADPGYTEELVLIAAPAYFSGEIERKLEENGIRTCITIDNDRENELMREYYLKTDPLKIPAESRHVCDGIRIYLAKTCHDKPLKEEYTYDECVYAVQAGRALADEKISELTDDTGDNISLKNADYCEMTVTYWVWKNTVSDYKGICHYRRLWRPDDINVHDGYDVYLPYPNIYYPGAYVHHRRFIDEGLWQHFIAFMNDYDEKLGRMFNEFENGRYMSNYNMLVAKQDIFDSYAAWIFDILFCFEKYLSDRNVRTPKRYMGFFAENLTPFYFMYLHKEIRTAYTGKDTVI